jgi:hypothetical protein
MANVDRANGFKPVQKLDGSPWNGKLRKYYIPTSSSSIFVGSPVKLAGSADPTGKYPSIDLAAAGQVPVGICMGIEPTVDNMNPKYSAKGTANYALVCDDPYVVMEVQVDAALDVASVGLNTVWINESGNTTTGISTVEIDADADTTNTKEVKIIGFVPAIDNDANTENNKVLVAWNEHQYMHGATGI